MAGKSVKRPTKGTPGQAKAKPPAKKSSRRIIIPKTAIGLAGNVWEQQAEEPTEWYLRFCRYINSPQPNINGVYRQHLVQKAIDKESQKAPKGTDSNIDIPTIAASIRQQAIPGNWKRAIQVFRWQERLKGWQAHQAQEHNELWRKRSEAYREQSWKLYEETRDKVSAMLKIPILKQRIAMETDANGNPITVTVIEPARWTFRDLAALMGQTIALGDSAIGVYSKAIMLLTTAGFEVRSPEQQIDGDWDSIGHSDFEDDENYDLFEDHSS
jgi:hypothetical protein